MFCWNEPRLHLKKKITQVSAACHRIANPGDDVVPLPFLGGGIVDQDTSDSGTREVAAVVPDFVVTKAGHHKKARRDLLVHDVGRWLFLRQEDCR